MLVICRQTLTKHHVRRWRYVRLSLPKISVLTIIVIVTVLFQSTQRPVLTVAELTSLEVHSRPLLLVLHSPAIRSLKSVDCYLFSFLCYIIFAVYISFHIFYPDYCGSDMLEENFWSFGEFATFYRHFVTGFSQGSHWS